MRCSETLRSPKRWPLRERRCANTAARVHTSCPSSSDKPPVSSRCQFPKVPTTFRKRDRRHSRVAMASRRGGGFPRSARHNPPATLHLPPYPVKAKTIPSTRLLSRNRQPGRSRRPSCWGKCLLGRSRRPSCWEKCLLGRSRTAHGGEERVPGRPRWPSLFDTSARRAFWEALERSLRLTWLGLEANGP